MPTNQTQYILLENNNNNCLSFTLLASSTFSHSCAFTITATPPTPSHFPDHHSLYPLPFIPSILSPSPLHLTSCKQTHQLSFFSVLHKCLPPFHSDYLNFTSQPAPKSAYLTCYTASYACTLQVAWLHLPFYGKQVPRTPAFLLVGAHNN